MYSLWLTKTEKGPGPDLDTYQETSIRYICILTLQKFLTRRPVYSVYRAGIPRRFSRIFGGPLAAALSPQHAPQGQPMAHAAKRMWYIRRSSV